MKDARRETRTVVTVLAVAAIGYILLIANAGELEPTGPPGPTMKTLDEVEPRIPIPGSATPAGVFTISSPGSYYLTGDRRAGGNGLEVTAADVTIDLMGYSLIGPESGTNTGISMNGRSNVEVRNGIVRDFGNNGISNDGFQGTDCRVVNVRAISNNLDGVCLGGSGNLVKDCTAADNGQRGIYVADGSTVTGNTVRGNGSHGVCAGAGSTVSANTCLQNLGDGIYAVSRSTVVGNTSRGSGSYGIHAGTGSVVSGNAACDNGAFGIFCDAGCTAMGNAASGHAASYGIYASSGCTVIRNTSCENESGIHVDIGSTVSGNTAMSNQEHGIYVAGDALIDGNTASGNNLSGGGYPNLYADGSCTIGLNHAP